MDQHQGMIPKLAKLSSILPLQLVGRNYFSRELNHFFGDYPMGLEAKLGLKQEEHQDLMDHQYL